MSFLTFSGGGGGSPANISANYDLLGQASGISTAATTSSTANTMGAWAELSSSAPFDIAGGRLFLHVAASGGSRFLVDLGVGAAGAETVLVPGIPVTPGTIGTGPSVIDLPLNIAAGTRISVRAQQAASGATPVYASFLVEQRTANHPPLWNSCERITSAPSTTAPSNTDVTAVTSAGTGWTTLNASTSRDYGALMVAVGVTTTPTNAQQFSLRLATGAAASETLVARIPGSTSSTSPGVGRWPGNLIRKAIPAGTRIAGEVLGNSAAGDLYRPYVIGFY